MGRVFGPPDSLLWWYLLQTSGATQARWPAGPEQFSRSSLAEQARTRLLRILYHLQEDANLIVNIEEGQDFFQRIQPRIDYLFLDHGHELKSFC